MKIKDEKMITCTHCVPKAMIIDDVEEDIYVMERMMMHYRFTHNLIRCSNALDALAYLQQHCLEEEQLPEIIFLDLNMPDLSGFDFLDHYSQLPDSVRRKCSLYVYTSSREAEETFINGKYPNVAGYIPKPINPIYLLGVSNDHHNRFNVEPDLT